MIRVMLDTDNPATLGRRADILATYADLLTAAQVSELEATWGVVVLIDRGLGDLTGRASVIDIETGTHKPADAPGWYDRQHGKGIKYLTTYANRSTMPAVAEAMGKRGYFRWYATLDGTAHIDGYAPGQAPAAVQILGEAQLGFHADLSLVFEQGWNPSPAPSVPAFVKTAADHAVTLASEATALAQLLRAGTA